MKRVFFLLILSTSLFTITLGQTATGLFSKNDSTVGTSHVTGLPVKATRFSVPGKLADWHWDGYSDNLLLELKETNNKGRSFINGGTIHMVDMATKNVKWSRAINYNSSDVKLQDNYYFLSEKKKNYCLHPETGDVLWENRNEFYFIDPFLHIGVGYPLQSLSNTLTAVDLSNGKELWKKKISRVSGWNDAYMLNDETLLISVDGIKAINLANGKGWTYKASTSNKEIGKMIAFNVFNIILGLIFDIYVLQSEPDVSSDMVSNMLIDPYENTILASKNRISMIDGSGKIQWSTPLPEKKTSKSSLFLVDTNVFMVNRGYALYNRNFSTIGDPYFASFDLQSGKQLFLTTIAGKKEFIRNYLVVNDRLFVVFEDKIAAYSLRDGTMITEKTLELRDGESLDVFVDSGIYWKGNEPFFKELVSDFSNHNFMMTSQGRIFVLTDDLETILVYGQPDLYHKIAENSQYKLVSNNNTDFIILDNSYIPAATIKASDDLFIHQDKLFFFDKDSFWEINLHQLTQPDNLWHSIFKNIFPYIPVAKS
jgi:outer membrane protein assembly factor BamB